MNEKNNPEKYLYVPQEEIVNFIKALDKKIETLTVAFNEKYINDTARLSALFRILKLGPDDILDFYNATKKEEMRLQEKFNPIINQDEGADIQIDTSEIDELLKSILPKT
ncbi:MAG TPA: hypothetical protein VIL78_06525 [Hanamia sp.]